MTLARRKRVGCWTHLIVERRADEAVGAELVHRLPRPRPTKKEAKHRDDSDTTEPILTMVLSCFWGPKCPSVWRHTLCAGPR